MNFPFRTRPNESGSKAIMIQITRPEKATQYLKIQKITQGQIRSYKAIQYHNAPQMITLCPRGTL